MSKTPPKVMTPRELRTWVRGGYQFQKLRIQTSNRIVGNVKVKLGQEPGTKEDTLDTEGKRILAELRAEYKLISEAVVDHPQFEGTGVITDDAEFKMMGIYLGLEQSEKVQFAIISKAIVHFPIHQWLKTIHGIGPAMSAVLIAEINISVARHVSSLWKLAGLDVAPDGKGRSRRKEHLIRVTYINKKGKEAERDAITFNPFLKTKLIGVLAPSFLKSQNERYVTIYADYKHRLENHETYKDVSRGHRHNMAMRYMIKMFLADLWEAWRKIEGLPPGTTYHEAILGHVHGEEPVGALP